MTTTPLTRTTTALATAALTTARAAAPAAVPAVPPRRVVPPFPPIRRGSGGRHRLQQAVRHRPGLLATGLLAAATALAAGPLRPPAGPVPAAEAVALPRCTGSAPPF
ncbi:hypothetical protein ACIA8O_23905 [Kitasatospora sp. NPDC051853]|uniref:hypothetical protein n=1 Tax=Kitasatospora sp. NPDC051853 TaxID=3364058 RepID=UPI0037AA6B10